MKDLKYFLPAVIVMLVVAMSAKTTEVASKAPDLMSLNDILNVDVKQDQKSEKASEKKGEEDKKDKKDKKEITPPAKKPVTESNNAQPVAVNHDNTDSSSYNDGIYYGTGKGFNGNITVKVTVASKKINNVEITDHIDDVAYLNSAKSVIPSIIASQSTNVDAVSGATFSSNGIILATRDALAKSVANQPNEKPPKVTPKSTPTPPAVNKDNTDSSTYNDGAYYGVGKGFNGDITAKVTVASKKIKKIEITDHVDDKEYLDKAEQTILPAILKKQSTNVDVVSGATYSSNGIILAVRDALKNSVENKPNEEPPKATPQPTPTRPPRPTLTPRPTSTPKPITTPKPSGEEGNEGGEEAGLPNVVYEDGSYDGFLWGYSGYTDVMVTIVDSKISNIKIVAYEDDEEYFVTCLGLLDLVIQRQTTEGIDVVSGATFSSRGILGAIDHALSQAVND